MFKERICACSSEKSGWRVFFWARKLARRGGLNPGQTEKMSAGNLRWTSILSRGSSNTSSSGEKGLVCSLRLREETFPAMRATPKPLGERKRKNMPWLLNRLHTMCISTFIGAPPYQSHPHHQLEPVPPFMVYPSQEELNAWPQQH